MEGRISKDTIIKDTFKIYMGSKDQTEGLNNMNKLSVNCYVAKLQVEIIPGYLIVHWDTESSEIEGIAKNDVALLGFDDPVKIDIGNVNVICIHPTADLISHNSTV